MKKIYVISHCEADGQPSETAPTNKGAAQVVDLSSLFSDIQIDCIISSPYKRALDSINLLQSK